MAAGLRFDGRVVLVTGAGGGEQRRAFLSQGAVWRAAVECVTGLPVGGRGLRIGSPMPDVGRRERL